MIRFSCPHCDRAYVLADALAHLPLVCKGCGQRLAVPDPTPEPEAPPPPVPAAAPPPTPPPPVVVAPPIPPPAPVVAPPGDDFLSSAALAEIDMGKDEAKLLREPPPELLGPVKPPGPVRPPPPATPSATPPRSGKLIPYVVDAAAVLILLVVGALVGEVVAKKSTRDILTEAGSAPKFPPVDLLLWLGCAGFFVLVYVWLGTRGWTVGGWLKRRAG